MIVDSETVGDYGQSTDDLVSVANEVMADTRSSTGTAARGQVMVELRRELA